MIWRKQSSNRKNKDSLEFTRRYTWENFCKITEKITSKSGKTQGKLKMGKNHYAPKKIMKKRYHEA